MCLICQTLFKDENELTHHRIIVHQSESINIAQIPDIRTNVKSAEFLQNEIKDETVSGNLKIEFMEDEVTTEVNLREEPVDIESDVAVKVEIKSVVCAACNVQFQSETE